MSRTQTTLVDHVGEKFFRNFAKFLVQIAFECTPVSHRSLHKKSPKSFKSLQFRFLSPCSSGALVPLMSLCAISPVFVMSIDNQGWISDQVRKQLMKNSASFSFLKSCILNVRYFHFSISSVHNTWILYQLICMCIFICIYGIYGIPYEYMWGVDVPASEYMCADLSIDVSVPWEEILIAVECLCRVDQDWLSGKRCSVLRIHWDQRNVYLLINTVKYR